MPLPIRLGLGKATEEWTAKQHARLSADLVAMVQTLPFAVITLDLDPGLAPTLVFYAGMHGTGLVAAPSLAPTAAGAEITWSRSYDDSYEEASFVRVKHAKATAHGATARSARATITDLNVVEVAVSDDAGADIASRVSVTVY